MSVDLPFKIVSSFAVPKGTVFFAPEVELRRIVAPDGTLIREEFVYWKKGGAVLLNVKEPDGEKIERG